MGRKGRTLSDTTPRPWYRRVGLRDAKRVVVLLVLLFYASGLFVALGMRRAVLVQVAPVRATLYRVGPDGRIYNQFRYRIANRGSRPGAVVFSIAAICPERRSPSATNPVAVQPANRHKASSRSPARRAAATSWSPLQHPHQYRAGARVRHHSDDLSRARGEQMKRKQSVPVLIPFLILVSMLFIGILIFAYVETKKANPQMIRQSRDRQGSASNCSLMTCTLCALPSGEANLLLRGVRERVCHPAGERRGRQRARISATPSFSRRACNSA